METDVRMPKAPTPKPKTRITVDMDAARHQWLRRQAAEAGGSMADFIRAAMDYLASDPGALTHVVDGTRRLRLKRSGFNDS